MRWFLVGSSEGHQLHHEQFCLWMGDEVMMNVGGALDALDMA
jgi:hypothetical protein